MGPPGAGKGTQAESSPNGSASRRSPPATSSGPTSRRAPSSASQAKRYMDAGDYVPDEVTNAMVRNRIDEPDARRGLPARRLPAHARPGRRARRDDRGTPATRSTPSWCSPSTRDELVAAPHGPGPERGTCRRHRGRDPAPPGGLRRADRAADRGLPRARPAPRGRRPAARSRRSPARPGRPRRHGVQQS